MTNRSAATAVQAAPPVKRTRAAPTPFGKDVPLSGHIGNTKIALRCARCSRTAIFDRPQVFTMAENRRQAALRRQGADVLWSRDAQTQPARLDEIDLPACPCGERYADDGNGTLRSLFPSTERKDSVTTRTAPAALAADGGTPMKEGG